MGGMVFRCVMLCMQVYVNLNTAPKIVLQNCCFVRVTVIEEHKIQVTGMTLLLTNTACRCFHRVTLYHLNDFVFIRIISD